MMGRSATRTRSRGVALLLALFMIVLLGALAVMWLSSMRPVRRTSSALNQQGQLAAQEELALDLFLGGLREQIRQDAAEPDLPPPFMAARPSARRPPRSLPDGLSDLPGIESLFFVSHPMVPLPLGLEASRVSLASAQPAPNLDSASLGAALPPDQVHWIYVTAGGPLREADALAQPGTVTGRIYFTLWDLGGKVDLNHAGNPLLAANDADPLQSAWMGRRGSLRAWPRGELPGAANGVIDLVRWREPVTSVAADFTSYRGFVENFVAATGGRVAREGAQHFLGRKDLLKLAGELAPAVTAEELRAYNTFSRGLAEPLARVGTAPGLADEPVAAVRVLTPGEELPMGSPVLARRFPLDRLDLLGYAFPTRPGDDPARQAEIRRWFGLERVNDALPWSYAGSVTGATQTALAISTLEQIAAEPTPREPNFFETLKAAILPGSLGQFLPGAAAGDAHQLQRGGDAHLLQIGLNFIDQWDADSFPTVLEVTLPGVAAPLRLAGVENLPYLSQLHVDALNPLWWWQHSGTAPVKYEERRLMPYLIPELWMPHQVALAVPPGSARWLDPRDPAAGPPAIRVRLEGTFVLSLNGAPASRPPETVTYGAGSGALEVPASEFTSYGPVPRPILTGMPTGCWDQEKLSFRGTDIASPDPSVDGRIPDASFYAARLVPNPTDKEVLSGFFNARPFSVNYVGVPPTGIAEYNRTDLPYFGMTRQGSNPYTYNIPAGELQEVTDAKTQALLLQLGANPTGASAQRFDVILDYRDHNGNWVPYSSFAAGSPNHATTHGLGNELPILARLFSGRWLSNDLPADRAWQRLYTDASGPYSFIKGDPRTARLGVALTESPGTNALLGSGGLPPRSPMRWDSVLDLESSRWGEIPQPVNPSQAAPNLAGPGGYDGRGLVNYFLDHKLDGKADRTLALAKFKSGDALFKSAGFGSIVRPYFFPGLLGENLKHPITNLDWQSRETHYADPDGVVRPGDGWLWRHAQDQAHSLAPGELGDADWVIQRGGNNLYTNQAAFPRVLNRAFQSIAELGNVFQDLPQRSLDLTSPASADAALLDAFTLHEAPVNPRGRSLIAGVIDPNAMGIYHMTSFTSGTTQAEPQLVHAFPASPFQDLRESNVRTARFSTLLPRVNLDIAETDKQLFPLAAYVIQSPAETPADLVTALADVDRDPETTSTPAERPRVGPLSVRGITGADSYPALSNGAPSANPAVKSEREAPLRAIADVSNTRVWNLFLDLGLETGRIRRGAPTLDSFTAQARRRHWYHVAIDRATGEILEVQRERADW